MISTNAPLRKPSEGAAMLDSCVGVGVGCESGVLRALLRQPHREGAALQRGGVVSGLLPALRPPVPHRARHGRSRGVLQFRIRGVPQPPLLNPLPDAGACARHFAGRNATAATPSRTRSRTDHSDDSRAVTSGNHGSDRPQGANVRDPRAGRCATEFVDSRCPSPRHHDGLGAAQTKRGVPMTISLSSGRNVRHRPPGSRSTRNP